MPIRRGDEFLESLRDGRRVWLGGELVEDVTAHPSLIGCARSVAAVYDLQHVPAYQDLLAMHGLHSLPHAAFDFLPLDARQILLVLPGFE